MIAFFLKDFRSDFFIQIFGENLFNWRILCLPLLLNAIVTHELLNIVGNRKDMCGMF